MQKTCLILGLTICLAKLAIPACAQLPPLTLSSLDRYQQAVEPTPDEVAFLEIDWQSTLGKAVAIAHEADKPLMIYVMNGHPLGCT